VATSLVRMESSACPSHTTNRGAVASRRFPPLLEVALQNPSGLWTQAHQPRASGAHLPHGCGNPTWGAPRIHGELLKLGFEVSEPTVSRWLRRAPRSPDISQRWLSFLRNHRDAIAAMDFFTVPTLTFGVLYCFFVIGHDRRRILRLNVTRNPNGLWIMQQLREAWPYAPAHNFLLFDHDSKFSSDVVSFATGLGS